MTSGSIWKSMVLFAMPIFIGNLFQQMYNTVDSLIVGIYLGSEPLAAVSSSGSLIFMLVGFLSGVASGAGVVVARFFGAQDTRQVKLSVHTTVVFGFVMGVFLTIIGVWLSPVILRWMGTPESVMDNSVAYLRVYFMGSLFSVMYNVFVGILQAVGDSRHPLYYLIISSVFNLVLDIVFISFFHMGVEGAAWATVISQIISAGLVLRCLFLEEKGFKLYIGRLKINREIVFKILKVGLPAGFQGIVFSLSNVVIQSSVNSFGSIVIAGNSAASNLEGFVYVSMNAFHQAAITATSQTMGAGKKERLNSVVIISQVCVLCVGLLLGWSMLFLGPWLLQIYSSSPEVIDAGLNRISIIGPTYALCGMMDVMVGVLRGIGYSLLPMVVSLVGACGLRLLWIATVFQIPSLHTIIVLYISYPVSWVLTFLAHVSCFVWARKKLP